jgi:threonine/homoserine/homoserine lactone efflux protein
MTLTETALAVLLLLLTPGPTNTLLAVAGAERGWGRAVRLIPAELGGYLCTVVPLTLAGARLLEHAPVARTVLTLGAALWVGWLAVAMWRLPAIAGGSVTVTARRVAVTTLLNPKALVFGLLILPAAEAGRQAANLVLFAGEAVAVAMLWAALGAGLRARRPGAPPGLPPAWRRGTSVLLGAMSLWLLGRVAGMA